MSINHEACETVERRMEMYGVSDAKSEIEMRLAEEQGYPKDHVLFTNLRKNLNDNRIARRELESLYHSFGGEREVLRDLYHSSYSSEMYEHSHAAR